jgi:hypothetical protein
MGLLAALVLALVIFWAIALWVSIRLAVWGIRLVVWAAAALAEFAAWIIWLIAARGRR